MQTHAACTQGAAVVGEECMPLAKAVAAAECSLANVGLIRLGLQPSPSARTPAPVFS
jgi:hypothetical protein